MSASSLRSFRATAVKHHDRGVTLVFGSDGQVSLLGFDDGIPTQPLGIPPTITASITGAPTTGTRPPPTGSPLVSPISNLEATATSSAGTSSFASASTSRLTSSLAPSSYDPSSTATDTDTFLPTIPTINYPAPNPTAVSAPKDHGVGAPFYLAMVLASISFVGCVAAFIAWWIRSRTRKHDLEHDDPWHHRDSLSDAGSPLGGNASELRKGAYAHVETQTRPYYLPASIVRRSSPNLLAVPHTISTVEGETSQNAPPRAMPDGGPLHHTNDQRPRNGPSSSTANSHSRPGTERLQTGLSVQESTRTLGRLRVANKAPGDFTSGDEGGINIPRTQNSVRVLPITNYGGPNPAPAGEMAVQEVRVDQGDRSIQGSGAFLEPPGPATMSWGRRIDTVAALRRTRRRAPETAIQTHKSPMYSGYSYPTSDGRPSDTMRQAPDAASQEENGSIPPKSPPDPLGWTTTLKSSFWQAVDAMTGNRPSDPGPPSRAVNSGGGSRFTPAPQRVASRRSPVSPTRSINDALTDTRTARWQETEIRSKETPRNMTSGSSRSSSTRTSKSCASHLGKDPLPQVDSPPVRVSQLNHDLGPSPHRQHLNPPKADTGSVYSTDSAAARANLRKYGYTDSIPSTWSALGASRESQLELSRASLLLPGPTSSPSPSPGPGPGSIAPSQLRLESSSVSDSVSVRSRTMTTVRSETDNTSSDNGLLPSGQSANAAATSVRSVSRDETVRSGRSAAGTGAIPLPSLSTTSSVLSRKKGVATRRKRPRLPPRAPSTASSVQSVESGLSVREVAVRRALLERRKRVKAVGSSRGHGDVPPPRSHDVDGSVGITRAT